MQTEEFNLGMKDFPFVKFDYSAKNRTDSIYFHTKIVPKVPDSVPQKKSRQVVGLYSLAPSGNGSKRAILDISEVMDDVRLQLLEKENHVWGDTIEKFRFVVNPEHSWSYENDGDLFIDNFRLGYEAIRYDLDGIEIIGQNFYDPMSAGFKRVFSSQDLILQVSYKDYVIPITECMPLNENYNLVFEDGEGYTINNNVISVDNDLNEISELTVPTYINLGDQRSNTFNLKIPIQIVTSDEIYDQNLTFVYPNPVEDILTISTEDNVVLLEIEDLNGVVHYSTSSSSVDLSSLPTGLYLAKIITGSGLIQVQKILKK